MKLEHKKYTPRVIIAIEIATVLVLFIIARYLKKNRDLDGLANSKFYFLIILLGIMIIHNLIIGGWHHPKDFVFAAVLIFLGFWVWRDTTELENFFASGQKIVKPLGNKNMDYNLPPPGRNIKSDTPDLIGNNINEAHPPINTKELVWGNRPEHYDFTPDDIPGYLELDDFKKMKNLKQKIKQDKNYKYLAEIQAFDGQSVNRPGVDAAFLLHKKHGLDDVFLENADNHEAYKLPKEVLDNMSGCQKGRRYPDPNTIKKTPGSRKYYRNNGVPGSWYKFLKEPDDKVPDDAIIECNPSKPSTTRPDDLKTSPDRGVGPVVTTDTIVDEMIEANNKFRTAEYFTVLAHGQADPYSYESDEINSKLPGSSFKVSQYSTNYPLVSKKSLSIISDNSIKPLF